MDRNYAGLESVQRHLRDAHDVGSMVLKRRLEVALSGYISQEADSPIEAIFALWWEMFTIATGVNLDLKLYFQFGFAPIDGRNYRADFAIWPRDLSLLTPGSQFRCVIVELDGHDYHERTKEQVIERNQRDRAFQEKGYLVFHFSGSELHRDPGGAVLRVMKAACAEYEKVRRLGGDKDRFEGLLTTLL